jgi:hypothetical protein
MGKLEFRTGTCCYREPIFRMWWRGKMAYLTFQLDWPGMVSSTILQGGIGRKRSRTISWMR